MISTKKFNLTDDWMCPRCQSALCQGSGWAFLKGVKVESHRQCLLSIESINVLGSLCASPTVKLGISQSIICGNPSAFFPQVYEPLAATESQDHLNPLLTCFLWINSVLIPSMSAQPSTLIFIWKQRLFLYLLKYSEQSCGQLHLWFLGKGKI